MTRCSYIPPEGESVIAIAKERGGTTDGDIQALIDRFGCKAEATRIIGRAGSTVIDAHACNDHVGHLLGDAPCAWVEPVGSAPPPGWDETSDVTIAIVRTDAAPCAVFGQPIILSQSPTAPPVVDLGENPTREQLRAAGFSSAEKEYREALTELQRMAWPPPYTVGDEIEWRTGPLDDGWHPGRVTSVIDDRPNDGIDKPFWIVRVDTAGERRFSGPAVAVCLRQAPGRRDGEIEYVRLATARPPTR